MKLKRKQIPIVFKDDKKIIWHSYNWCPVLEACKKLNLETKRVCKNGWEESINKMIKVINPRLIFKRNYKKIRPKSRYCEEILILKK